MELTRRILKLRLKSSNLSNQWANEDLVGRMIQFMQQHQGIGLAANQVGQRVRMFVMHIDQHSWACFNPEIVQSSILARSVVLVSTNTLLLNPNW